MAAQVTVTHDPFVDGYGKTSAEGMYFMRRVQVNGNGSTTVTIAPSDVGCQRIVRVHSIVPQANDTVYVSTPPVDGKATSIAFTWANGATKFEAFLQVAGM